MFYIIKFYEIAFFNESPFWALDFVQKNAYLCIPKLCFMKLDPCNPKPWRISKEAKTKFSIAEIKQYLAFFNQAANSCFYLVDYKTSQFIFGKAFCPTLCGYSREVIRREKFQFYDRILSDDEKKWLKNMHKNALKTLYQYEDVELRKDIEISYDLGATDYDGKTIALHQKLIPCEWDQNDNLWRALCFVWTSPATRFEHQAKIKNYKTGDQFNYVNEQFTLSKLKSLIQDEILILKYLANGLSVRDITIIMNIPKTAVEQKIRGILTKLDAKNQTHAVCKAFALGYIQL